MLDILTVTWNPFWNNLHCILDAYFSCMSDYGVVRFRFIICAECAFREWVCKMFFFSCFFYNCILFGRFNIRHIFGTSGYISVNFLLGYTLGFLRSGIIESAWLSVDNLVPYHWAACCIWNGNLNGLPSHWADNIDVWP